MLKVRIHDWIDIYWKTGEWRCKNIRVYFRRRRGRTNGDIQTILIQEDSCVEALWCLGTGDDTHVRSRNIVNLAKERHSNLYSSAKVII